MSESPRDLIKETVGESEAWSMVAKDYNDMIHAFSAFHDYAISTAHVNDNAVVLDLACGSGGLTRMLHSKVRKVYSYDFSIGMIHIINSYIAFLQTQIFNISLQRIFFLRSETARI